MANKNKIAEEGTAPKPSASPSAEVQVDASESLPQSNKDVHVHVPTTPELTKAQVNQYDLNEQDLPVKQETYQERYDPAGADPKSHTAQYAKAWEVRRTLDDVVTPEVKRKPGRASSAVPNNETY